MTLTEKASCVRVCADDDMVMLTEHEQQPQLRTALAVKCFVCTNAVNPHARPCMVVLLASPRTDEELETEISTMMLVFM